MLHILWGLNQKLLVYLNTLWDISFIHSGVTLFADTPIFFLPVFLVGMWIWKAYKHENDKKNNLLYIFYSVCIAILLSLIIQKTVHVQRPEMVLKGVGHLLLKHIPDASFPSDHACVSSAFLTALFLSGYKKTAYYFLPFVLLMLLSRVIAGVHYPFDILAWILIGICSAFFVFKFLAHQKVVKIWNGFIIKTLSYIKL